MQIGKTMIMSGGEVIVVDFIEVDGRAWLVPVWLETLDGKSRRPLRLIAPRFAPGYTPVAGPEVLEIFRQMPLPKSLLEQGVIPEELKPVVEVRENPDISVPHPKKH